MTHPPTKYWNQRMTEETKHEHAEQGFEHQDLAAQGVLAFLASLIIGGVVVYFVIWGLYHFLEARQREHQPELSPLVKQVETDTRIVSPDEVKKFPQPRLERNERTEIKDFRLKEEQTLNSYGWVDEKAGVVRIPIDRAMELLAERGLPTTPKAGTVPSSEVNVATQAAKRSDTSGKSAQPKSQPPK
jgi:hypothetical protein